jgi:hypothetical protein
LKIIVNTMAHPVTDTTICIQQAYIVNTNAIITFNKVHLTKSL